MQFSKKTNSRKKRYLNINRNKHITFACFTIPGFILYSLLFIFPILSGLFYSLTDWNGISKNFKFIGFKNYIRLFDDQRFLKALMFNFKYCIMLTICIIILGLILAILLNRKIKGISLFRAVYFFPAVLSMLTVGLVFNQIFYRAIPPIGQSLGIEFLSKNILSHPDMAIYGILFVNVWQGVAMPTLLFLAGLQTIPEELFEAAAIDGANAWNRFKSITIPFILPVLSVVLVLTVKSGLMVFDYVKSLTEGGPGGVTESVSLLIYNNAYVEMKYSYAITEAVFVGIIIALVSAIQIKLTNRKEEYL